MLDLEGRRRATPARGEGAPQMGLGMSAEAFTRLHVGVSLIALASGFVTLLAMLGRRGVPGVTALFLTASVLASVSGFFLASTLGAQQLVGFGSLAVLGLAMFALYVRRLVGAWRAAYVLAATAALWLDVVLAIQQAFQTVPALVILAPTESEPPYFAAQAGMLVLFACLAALALRTFQPPPVAGRDRPAAPGA
jgi:hypothetical protein